jgi:hypothetical protein
MVPSTVVLLPALPSDHHGKRDLAALRAMLEELRARRESHVPPANDIEERLAGLWERLLDVQSVGRFDNFFALGGHSMAAIRLRALISQEFGVSLEVTSIVRHPVLAEIAAVVADEADGGALV